MVGIVYLNRVDMSFSLDKVWSCLVDLYDFFDFCGEVSSCCCCFLKMRVVCNPLLPLLTYFLSCLGMGIDFGCTLVFLWDIFASLLVLQAKLLLSFWLLSLKFSKLFSKDLFASDLLE